MKDAQQKHFPQEVAALKKGKPIPPSSKLLSLNPELDDKGIMRVHGRILEAAILPIQRFPIILPKDHQFTISLVHKIHVEYHHAPVDWVHFHLRQQFWILNSRQIIRHVVSKCYECQKANSRRGSQIMAPLPKSRVCFEPPFSRVGVDYTAKFDIKATIRGAKVQPCYAVIFTCFVTRAIHVELVLSNEAEGFLMALKRMVSARGMPSHIFSDNASYFKRAEKELVETLEANNAVLKTFAEQYRLEWHYSTESHSQGGGVWERMVQTFKTPLRKILKDQTLTYVEMLTISKEVEAVINDRPLIAVSDDSYEVITPSMLCIGRRIRPWIDYFSETELDQSSNVRLRWEQRQNLVRELKGLWLRQYLPALQERSKWKTKQPNLKVGDLVLIETENIKKHLWPVARVKEIVRGTDGSIRTVLIKTSGGKTTLKRSVHDLFPLEGKVAHSNEN